MAKRLRLVKQMKNNVNVPVATTADLNGAWQYDGEGRLSGVTYPVAGRQINYGCDSSGMLITATDPSSSAGVTSAVGMLVVPAPIPNFELSAVQLHGHRRASV